MQRRTVGSIAALVALLLTAGTVVRTEEPTRSEAHGPWIGDMSIERAAHQSTLLRTGEVLVTGGCTRPGCERIVASVELYDPSTRSFRVATEMNSPRASHAAINLPDGRVLVTGGWTDRTATASAEVYNPETGRFATVDDMTEARAGHVAVGLPSGAVLIVGGESGTGAPLATAEIFDPTTSAFSAVKGMRTARSAHVATPLEDGRVLVAGGHRARGEILRSAEIFDPITGEFQSTGEMAVPRHKHAAVRLPDGRVLIIGGSGAGDYRERYSSTEIYDPASGTFSPGPHMNWPRYKLDDAVLALPSGDVLVVGGAIHPERYDHVDGVFRPLEAELSGPQAFATADLLPTGEVLVVGGYDDRIRPSASAWLIALQR